MAVENIRDLVVKIGNRRIRDLANQICNEMKAEIANGHIDTGKAYGSIHVYWNSAEGGSSFLTGAGAGFGGGFLNHVFIGSDEPSAYYLDQGNGGPGRIITSTRLYDSRGRKPGKLKLRTGDIVTYVHGYDGIHYVSKVANRHR